MAGQKREVDPAGAPVGVAEQPAVRVEFEEHVDVEGADEDGRLLARGQHFPNEVQREKRGEVVERPKPGGQNERGFRLAPADLL